MRKWRGFLTESKSYMAYGTKSCPKWKFWVAFPRAAIRFYWFEFKRKKGRDIERDTRPP